MISFDSLFSILLMNNLVGSSEENIKYGFQIQNLKSYSYEILIANTLF